MNSAVQVIPRGAYDRHRAAGVVHLGLGAFHRCHQAMVFEALLSAGDLRWGIVGVGMRNDALVNALRQREGWYPVLVEGDTSAWHWVGAVTQTLMASTESGQVTAAIAAPTTRWLTLSVTEKAYTPHVAALIVEGLTARRAGGLPGLTIASCDNLRDNGDCLKSLCLQVSLHNPAVSQWIVEHCRFPNSMVDRIVPAASAALKAKALIDLGTHAVDTAISTEPFWEWVIQDHFQDPSDAQVLRQVGVQVVADVRPFEDAKLGLLNGAHSAIAYFSVLAGWQTVDAFVQQPVACEWLERLMFQELGPGLIRPDWKAYANSLLTRFKNPALAHKTLQIAGDSSQKIPQRWAPAIGLRLAEGAPPRYLALASAAWMRYLLGVDEHGAQFTVQDPLSQQLQAIAIPARGDADKTVQSLGRIASIWGPLASQDEAWLKAVTQAYRDLETYGVASAMQRMLVIDAVSHA
jgi:fructuronate reductase